LPVLLAFVERINQVSSFYGCGGRLLRARKLTKELVGEGRLV
jgi:hypothetical protein